MTIIRSLTGLRVLVVEDEIIVSLLVEGFLEDRLCNVVGPYSNVGEALGPAQSADIDFALLDVNVHGVKVYPVAEALHARRVPFLLLSGYGEKAVPDDRPEWRACGKPYNLNDLATMMLDEINRGSQRTISALT